MLNINTLKNINKGLIQIKYYYKRKEGNVLFNNALNTFYLWLYMSDIW